MNREELEKLSTEELLALYKKKKTLESKYNVMQLGLKVTLNSAYGMIGNEYSRYFDTRIAEGITVSGQLAIRWIERKLNEYLNKVLGTENHDFAIAGDTDSIYLSLDPVVEKYKESHPDATTDEIVAMLDEVASSSLEPFIDKSYQELADYVNAFDQKMVMKREVIAETGIWRAKKNYALMVWNSEGVQYREPKLKIKGIEVVRSSTPEVCRNAISDALRLILGKTEKDIQKYVADFRKKWMNHEVEDISFPRGISDLNKWHQDKGFKSGTPIHVKAAMTYNRLLDAHNLNGQYRRIRNGDKIRFVYLKKANPTFNNAIAFPDVLPPEFNMERFIDRNKQFEKAFLEPVNSLLDVVGWSAEKKGSLKGFFGAK